MPALTGCRGISGAGSRGLYYPTLVGAGLTHRRQGCLQFSRKALRRKGIAPSGNVIHLTHLAARCVWCELYGRPCERHKMRTPHAIAVLERHLGLKK